MLALNEEVQQEIYEEVLGVLGAEETPTADHVPRLPLVRGLVKETLRYYYRHYRFWMMKNSGWW